MKTIARQNPECAAARVVPKDWLRAVPLLLKKHRPIHTVRDFIRALVQLGGFLGRKGDGEPGWQTIKMRRKKRDDLFTPVE
ncbi:MAG TPA: IS4 family transposase [Pirellulales bacterium]